LINKEILGKIYKYRKLHKAGLNPVFSISDILYSKNIESMAYINARSLLNGHFNKYNKP